MFEALLTERRSFLREQRSLGQALIELLATYQRAPDPTLARTIQLLRAEIDLRKRREPEGKPDSAAKG